MVTVVDIIMVTTVNLIPSRSSTFVFVDKEIVMGNRRKMRDIECVTVEYEGDSYEVWVRSEEHTSELQSH